MDQTVPPRRPRGYGARQALRGAALRTVGCGSGQRSGAGRARAEVREHGEDPAVVIVGGGKIELLEDRRDVLLDGPLRDRHALGDRLVRAALRDQPEHLLLAWAQLRERTAG